MMKKIFNDLRHLAEFDKDLKGLSKKFHTIEKDLAVFVEKQLQLFHKQNIDNKGIFPISGLGVSYPKIYKAKKFACRALKGRGAASGIRVIYAHFDKEDRIEFVEIYYKGDKENEDRERIIRYYKDKYSAEV
jgi:hypothetical protein